MAFILPIEEPWTSQPPAGVRADLSKGVSHLWALPNGARGVIDSAGFANGVFGSGTGGTTGNAWVIGPSGWEIKFDNTGTGTTASTKLLIGDSTGSAAPKSTRWTFEFDLYLGSLGTTQAIFGCASAGGIEIRITTTGAIELLKEAIALIGTSSVLLAANTRYKIAVTYDGSNAAFYVNGQPVGTATSAQTFTHSQYALGWAAGAGIEYLDNGSRLGRVVITERVLSAGEIADRYATPWQIFAP
jgi:hypothetical protein